MRVDGDTVKLRNKTVVMLSQGKKILEKMDPADTGVELFVIKALSLEEYDGGVRMELTMERKSFREMLTTYVPSAMLILITFATIFFDFSDALATLMTIILVMQGIFTSKVETLPPSSDVKMLDLWLIGCFIYPFVEMILRTIIETIKSNNDKNKHDEKDADKENVTAAHNDQQSGRKKSRSVTAVIQVEAEEGEAGGSPLPRTNPRAGRSPRGFGATRVGGWVLGAWRFLTKEGDSTFLSILKITGAWLTLSYLMTITQKGSWHRCLFWFFLPFTSRLPYKFEPNICDSCVYVKCLVLGDTKLLARP
jgi:hypothetical protein